MQYWLKRNLAAKIFALTCLFASVQNSRCCKSMMILVYAELLCLAAVEGSSLTFGGYKAYKTLTTDIQNLSSTQCGEFIKNYLCDPTIDPKKFRSVYASAAGLGYGASLYLFWKVILPKIFDSCLWIHKNYGTAARKLNQENKIIKAANIDDPTVGQMLEYYTNVLRQKNNDTGSIESKIKTAVELFYIIKCLKECNDQTINIKTFFEKLDDVHKDSLEKDGLMQEVHNYKLNLARKKLAARQKP